MLGKILTVGEIRDVRYQGVTVAERLTGNWRNPAQINPGNPLRCDAGRLRCICSPHILTVALAVNRQRPIYFYHTTNLVATTYCILTEKRIFFPRQVFRNFVASQLTWSVPSLPSPSRRIVDGTVFVLSFALNKIPSVRMCTHSIF